MNSHDDVPYLKHILDAINDIEDSIKNKTEKQFRDNKDVRDANIRRIEIIGEAVKNISNKLKGKYTDVEWKKIAGTRDVMIHGYFNVDIPVTWKILKQHIPILKKQIEKIKKDLEK
jgi:uncharacterized protein with HEPN domain